MRENLLAGRGSRQIPILRGFKYVKAVFSDGPDFTADKMNRLSRRD
jgi:hypothetical protein